MPGELKIATAVVTPWLADLETPFVALMTADPFTVMDPLSVEVSGYSRAPAEWTVSGRWLVPNYDLLFAGVPGGVSYAAIAGMDGPYAGAMIWSVTFNPVTVDIPGQVTIPAYSVRVGFRVP